VKKLITYIILQLSILPVVWSQSSFSLEGAIEYAIAHSDQHKLDSINYKDAEASITEYKSIGLPKVSGNFNYQYNIIKTQQAIQDFISPSVYGVLFAEEVLEERDLGDPATFAISFQTRHFASLGLEASTLLFDGSYLVGLQAAKMYKELASKSFDITEQQVRTNITKAYLSRLILDENILVLDKNIENLSKMSSDAKALYTEGFIEQLDVDRLELSLNNLNNEKTKLEQTKELADNLLKFQMNYPIDDQIELTQNFDDILDQFKVFEADLLQDANYNDRAEYAQLNTAQSLNELDLKRIEKGKLPSVRASAGLSGSIQRDKFFDSNESNILPASFVAVGVNLPIYDGNERSAQKQRKKLAIEKTQIQIEQFEKAVDIEVKNARITYLNSVQTLANLKSSLDLSENIYNKAVTKYQEGVGSSIEVNQAEQSLFQLQSQYINALYDLVVSKTNIDIALGKL